MSDQKSDLADVLSDFARTMITDFPIQAILDSFVERIVQILPITAAGVTLISEATAPRFIAASNDYALRCEKLQTDIGEGPCLAAFATGGPIAIADLTTDNRFPRFAAAAAEAGLVAVFTFPLRHGDSQLGALDLYRDTPGDLDERDMTTAQTLADVAAAYLLNAQARDQSLELSEGLRQTSERDALTGLPNRRTLQIRIEHAAERARRSHANTAILFVDLDAFKSVNDERGHHVGDELLAAVAHRLTGLVRPGDTLARVSGDEFVFVCEDMVRAEDADVLAARIDAAFCVPFTLPSCTLNITASVGIAYAGPGEAISNDLVIEADAAMYQAKRKGGAAHQGIDLRDALETEERSRLARDLRAAFAHDGLHVAYQPIVRSSDGLVTGVEALLRWTHQTRGDVPALTTVEVAERHGLISEIGAWVLERACSDREGWLRANPGARLEMAVNVSARQLVSGDFAREVEGVLTRTGMDRDALILEMTENIFIEDGEVATAALNELNNLGVRLALDDFGTGFSSLSYLRRLPVHIVKIDQSFISDVARHGGSESIVAAVTNLAHVLGLAVTAEGVETMAQRDTVDLVGCESSQGYFYARPMSAAAISAYLAAAPRGVLHLPLPALAELPVA